MTESLSFRRATLQDADLLLAWRNDDSTRLMSRNTHVIDRESHIRWLTAVLNDPNRALWIALDANTPVGTVRLDAGPHDSEISWTVAPDARGHGIGRRMICEFVNSVSCLLRAEIKSENTPSLRIAQAAGFTLDHEQNGWAIFLRQPYTL